MPLLACTYRIWCLTEVPAHGTTTITQPHKWHRETLGSLFDYGTKLTWVNLSLSYLLCIYVTLFLPSLFHVLSSLILISTSSDFTLSNDLFIWLRVSHRSIRRMMVFGSAAQTFVCCIAIMYHWCLDLMPLHVMVNKSDKHVLRHDSIL